jgi:DNA mismatch endonuclease (patch repair protein)
VQSPFILTHVPPTTNPEFEVLLYTAFGKYGCCMTRTAKRVAEGTHSRWTSEHVVSYRGFKPSTEQASKIARSSSKKSGSRCELALFAALQLYGIRVLPGPLELLGKPDFILAEVKMAIFVDGDFWHGRKLSSRLGRLTHGSNSEYWVRKIRANVRRDRRIRTELRRQGWTVLQFWEGDVLRDPCGSAFQVLLQICKKQAQWN